MAESLERQAVLRAARLLVSLLVAWLPSSAALLHDALGPFERLEPRQYAPSQAAILAEFRLEETEEAEYRTADGRSVVIRALQFYDDTGAVAAFSWLRPEGAEELFERGERAVQKGDFVLIQFANYLLSLRGDMPDEEDIEVALAYLPRPKPTSDPPVLKYVPADMLVPDSGRHILGPVSLEQLAPELAPSVVGFHFGTEGYYGRYATPSGEVRMIIWDYPSNPIARGQIEAFHALDGAVAKQDGPLIAVVLDSRAPDEAQRLLTRVRYRAEVTQHHEEPKRHDSLRNLILDTFILCGLLASLMVLGGVLVAGTRRLAGRIAPDSILANPQGADMQRLGLDGLDNARQRTGTEPL